MCALDLPGSFYTLSTLYQRKRGTGVSPVRYRVSEVFAFILLISAWRPKVVVYHDATAKMAVPQFESQQWRGNQNESALFSVLGEN